MEKNYQYKFKINHLLSEKEIHSDQISFSSPHYPSTENGKDYLEGDITLAIDKDSHSNRDIVIQGIETTFSLITSVYLPVEIHKINPENELPCYELRAEAHGTYPISNPEEVPIIFRKYFILLQNNHELRHSLSWFLRSVKSNEPIDKFIYSWITFNCLYGFLTGSDGHRNGIRGLIYNNIPSIEILNKIVEHDLPIFEYLSSLSLVDKRNIINWSEKLSEALRSKSIKEIVEFGICTIAIVRHTIFHGNIDDKKPEAERCIWPLLHINQEIIAIR